MSADTKSVEHQGTAYDVPAMVVPFVPCLTIAGRSNGDLVMTPAAGTSLPIEMTFTGTCIVGSDIDLWSSAFVGEVRNGDSWTPSLTPSATRPGKYTGAPMRRIGEATPDGRVDLTLCISRPARLPAFPVGCLDRRGLDSAVNTLESSEPNDVTVSGHGVQVALDPGTTGTGVLAVPRTRGWQCVLGDNRSETRGTAAGPIAVHADGKSTDISCWYRPPGVRIGLAAAGASLASLVLVWLILARRHQTEDHR